jgi:hypothetical protein
MINTAYMINTAVFYKKQELLTFREHQSSPPVAHLLIFFIWFDLVFNATFSNISAISWQPALVVEEARIPWENHRPRANNC